MKISFDFDGTLSNPKVQALAKMLVEAGHEIWIVTRRYKSLKSYTKEFLDYYNIPIDKLEEMHNHLFNVSDSIGIPRDRIVFMDMEWKYNYFKGQKFDWHLDDDFDDVRRISERTKVQAYHYDEANHEEISNKLLEICSK